MIVSWDWLKEYVDPGVSVDEVAERLTMTGLNLEETKNVAGDTAIDFEVTSNRADCLGHIGIAREAGVLFDRALNIPVAEPAAVSEKTASATSVTIECEDLCPRYIARVIRGVKVQPSPPWLQRRLATLGIAAVNNIVDITNYVLMECGQPLHAFDFDKLRGQRIVVRRARAGEKLIAINQREYALDPEMCVIADAERPVAIGGVMGGLETEIGEDTVNVLIETADFAPLSIRNTARALNLHSDSSYRFERRVDPLQLDWASRRCCQLILELAGGELLDGPVIAGVQPENSRPAIELRFNQLHRLLGIDIPREEAVRILTELGLAPEGDVGEASGRFVPPSWRRDLTREADLIEEVARIHGYDRIPENVPVPLQLSEKTHPERIADRVRETLTAAGFFEAVTISFVSEEQQALFTPHGNRPPLRVEHSSRKHENVLRQSLIPSLLQCRRENERQGTFNAQLFELARVYLQAQPGRPEAEPRMVGMVGGRSFAEVKGLVETLAGRINPDARVTVRPSDVPQFVPGRGAEVYLDDCFWGWLGEIDRSVADRLDLRDRVVVVELELSVLEETANLVPTFRELPRFPTVSRDLNFVLDETVTWQQLEQVVRDTAGDLLDSVGFGGQYRGKQIAADKKSYVVTLHYRSPLRTLTNDEVEDLQREVIAACEQKLGAALR